MVSFRFSLTLPLSPVAFWPSYPACSLIMAMLANNLPFLSLSQMPHQRIALQKEIKKVPANWQLAASAEVSEDRVFNVIIALKQRNTDKLARMFESRTNPESPEYGQWLSIEQLTAIVEPSQETIDTVSKWLSTHGARKMALDRNRDHIAFDATLSSLRKMFEVEFAAYTHRKTGRMHVTAVGTPSVPGFVAAHMDFAVGFTGFPSEPRKATAQGPRKADPKPETDFYQVGPVKLRERYNVTTLQKPVAGNKQAVAEFQGEYYLQSDLQAFVTNFYPNADPSWWNVTLKGTNNPSNPSTEGSLDIQYIIGMAPGIPTEYWSMAAFDFYSDLTRWYTQINNDPKAPWVHSVSYGSQGDYPAQSYMTRWNTEMQKIGLRGISILFASGDSGVGCFLCENFDPSFPAVSPYVTSVGATHFLQYGIGPEGAVTQFSSGGGLSWYDAIPSYQTDALANYFKVAQNLPSAGYFNRNGRSTPDLAAIGIGLEVMQGGAWQSVGGTSASCPITAGLISLLNNERLAAGKPTLGFLNPWIYQTAVKSQTAFYDVTQGNNAYTCCPGFYCAPGYDPVTGVGTPNYAALRTMMP